MIEMTETISPGHSRTGQSSIDQHLDEEEALIARHVYVDPSHSTAGEASLVDSGVKLWALVAYRDANIAGLGELVNAYRLSPEAVRAAFAYYRRHRGEINGRLALNEENG